MKKTEDKTIAQQPVSISAIRSRLTKHLSLEDIDEPSKMEANEYICSLCTGIYYKPLLDQCGHMFCRDCIHKAIEYTGGRCPINPSATVDKEKLLEIQFINNQLGKLNMLCRNSKLGCDWKGQFRDLEGHLNTACRKQNISCKNEGCKETYLREQGSEHQENCGFKRTQCEYCKESFPYRSMNEHHQNCQKMRIPCTQGCGELIEKCEMNLHLKSLCTNTLTDCLFSQNGCDKKIPMKDIQNHIGIPPNGCNHLKLLINSVDTYMHTIEDITKQQDDFKKRLATLEELITDQKFCKKEEPFKKKHLHPLVLTEDKPVANLLEGFHQFEFAKDIFLVEDEVRPNSEKKRFLHKKRERKISEEEPKTNEYLSIFDTELSSSDLSINGNVITCKSNDVNKQKFLFLRQNLTTYQDLSWKVKILHFEGKWLAFGVCFKDVVAFNNFCFKPKKRSDNHGGIMLDSDQIAWNSAVSDENHFKLQLMPEISESTEIVMKYSCSKNTLSFTIGEWTRVLHGVNAKKVLLCPCIAMVSMNDSIEFAYI